MDAKRYGQYLILLIFTVILATIIYLVGFEEIVQHIRLAYIPYILLAVVSMFLYHIFLAINYVLFFRISFIKALLIILSGEFFNVISPGINIGGEPLKGYLLAKIQKKEFSTQFSAALSVKLIDAAWYVFFGALSIIFGVLFVHLPMEITIIAQATLFITLFVVLILFIRKSVTARHAMDESIYTTLKFFRLIYRFTITPSITYIQKKTGKKTLDYLTDYMGGKIEKIKTTTTHFAKETKISLRRIFSEKRIFFPLFIFNFMGWMFLFFKTYLVFLAFGHQIHFITAILAWMLPSFLGSLLFVPGGVGVTETFMIGLFFAFGISPEIAAAIAIIDRAIFYFWGLGGGYVSFAILKFWKKV
jgi:uncharacterized protein (TIRG00374 family)